MASLQPGLLQRKNRAFGIAIDERVARFEVLAEFAVEFEPPKRRPRENKVSRAFALTTEVDEATAQAKYDNGVLELRLPKRAAAKTKSLTIH